MKTGLLLSVREKAKRLPGKVLLPFGKYNVTEHLLRRLMTSKRADEVVLSTSIDKRDDVLVEIAKRVGVAYFQGSEDDKLVRYRDTARKFRLDFVVVVDGDDPFCSMEHIDTIIERAAHSKADYFTWEGLPLGATGFGARVQALECICEEKTIENTEVWGHLFTENPNFISDVMAENKPIYNRPDIRMTLDYAEDYDFFKAVIEGLRSRGEEMTFKNIMNYLDEYPEVVTINLGVQEKALEHFERSKGA